MSEAEMYALMKHDEVCSKWLHGWKCSKAMVIDVEFYEQIKGENK